MWRSRFDEKNNLVVINNGHRDYRYAAEKHARKLRYICRLFSKELVLANFPGFGSTDLLERMIELSMYTEERLKLAAGSRGGRVEAERARAYHAMRIRDS